MKNSMVRSAALCASAALLLMTTGTALVRADADDLLYSDPDGQSSATIVQVLPNSPSTQMILTNVKSIRVHQEILIISWSGSATTLLPRQFVSEITVNKRIIPSPTPTTAPATH